MRAQPGHERLTVNADTGVLSGVRFIESPNFDERPPGSSPELIVIHGISLPPGEFGGPWIEALFTNTLPAAAHPYFETLQGVQVSAHVLVRRDGSIMQFVPFDRRAWHAGESNWGGRARCNDFSIGIELEGTDFSPYADAQYTALAALVLALLDAYPGLTSDSIAGHADIAPGRKTDPGPAFDWPRLRALVQTRLQLPHGEFSS